jgi:hypothetical protein
MESEELSKMVKYERQFNWSLNKHMVEQRLGYEISNEEFVWFAKHFESNFLIQFAETLNWQCEDWDEVKTWKDPGNPDISHLL